MIIVQNQVGANALTAIAGHMAGRSGLCAKVIDADGRVVGINHGGLDLLGIGASEICGRVWADLWDGEAQVQADQAVRSALQGTRVAFVGEMHSGTGVRHWHCEAFPLEDAAGVVTSVLVLSSELATEDAKRMGREIELQERLAETLHAMGNVSAIAASGSHILRRGIDEARANTVADALEEASRKATEAIAALKALLR